MMRRSLVFLLLTISAAQSWGAAYWPPANFSRIYLAEEGSTTSKPLTVDWYTSVPLVSSNATISAPWTFSVAPSFSAGLGFPASQSITYNEVGGNFLLSDDTTVNGALTATSFSGDGSGLTGISTNQTTLLSNASGSASVATTATANTLTFTAGSTAVADWNGTRTNFKNLPLAMGGTTWLDTSRNGTFAGLTVGADGAPMLIGSGSDADVYARFAGRGLVGYNSNGSFSSVVLQGTGGKSLDLAVNNNTFGSGVALHIDQATGNVSIGNGTTAGTEKLDVTGNVKASDTVKATNGFTHNGIRIPGWYQTVTSTGTSFGVSPGSIDYHYDLIVETSAAVHITSIGSGAFTDQQIRFTNTGTGSLVIDNTATVLTPGGSNLTLSSVGSGIAYQSATFVWTGVSWNFLQKNF